MRIAICDDERKQINTIKGYLNKALKDVDYSIIEAESGEELIEVCKNEQLDLVFLDIEMKKLNGIETGKEIREMNKDAVIVFVTGFRDYALQAFGIRAFDYIIKPLTEKKFDVFFNDVQTRLKEIQFRNEKDSRLLVKSKSVMKELSFDEIVFFEKSGHQVIVHVENGDEIAYYNSFKDLKKELGEGLFVQCHQGYIINMDFVSSYKDKVITLRDDFGQIPVSKTFVKVVKTAIEKRLFK